MKHRIAAVATGVAAALALAAAPAGADYVKVEDPTGAVFGPGGGIVVGVDNGDRTVEGGICYAGYFPAYYWMYVKPPQGLEPPGDIGYTEDGVHCSGDKPAVRLGTTTADTTTATLRGEVRGNGLETTYRFEYRKGTSGSWTATPTGTRDVEWSWAEVSADVEGLEPGTRYSLRLIAENASGETVDSFRFDTKAG